MRKLLIGILLFGLVSILHAQNCSINAGISTTICIKDSMLLNGTRAGLLGNNSVSIWSQVSGPSVIINSPNSLLTKVTGFDAGNYRFKISIKCKDGLFAEDFVTVNVLPLTAANAGNDTLLCPTDLSILNGNVPQSGETGLWSISGQNSAGITLSSPANPFSPVVLNPNTSGVTTLKWTIMNQNGCISFDEVKITNCGGVPQVNAGPDQVLGNCFSSVTCATLTATNGGIGFGGQKGVWSFVSGPSLPAIAIPGSPSTKVCNLIQGTYVFRYTVTGPCANGFDDVVIVVPPPTQDITTANANVFSNSTVFCGIVNTISLNGNIPLYTGESVSWSQASGQPVTINNANSPSATISGITEFGTYCFKYTIINSLSNCTSVSTVCYTLYNVGTVNAGPDKILPCNVTSATIATTTTGSGVLNFKIISGPSGVFPAYPVNYRNSNIITGMNNPGTYRVEVNYSFGLGCSPVNDFVDITVSRPPTGTNAGSDQNFACVSATTQLAGNNPYTTGIGSGRWSQISGPNISTLLTPTNYICNVSGTIPGTYTYRWTVSGGNNCPDNFDDMAVIIPDTSVTGAFAGLDNVICPNSTFTLQGNNFRADETVQWTASPGGITFLPNNAVAAPVISGLQSNVIYKFIYTITNSCGSISRDTVQISTSAAAGPSAADAGSNQCLSSSATTINLNAAVPLSGIGNWSQSSGPSVTITNPALNNTTVTGATVGTYTFVWKVSSPGCLNFSTDTVLITISGNTTTANAGTDITACSNSIVLNANTATIGSGRWSQLSGDGDAVLSSFTNPAATVSNLRTGLYTFRWTITNNACPSSSDDVKLIISSPPSASFAGSDQTFCGATAITLNANEPAEGTGQWVQVSGPSASLIANNTSANTSVSNLTNGTYTFRWIVTGGPGCPQSTDEVLINISLPADAGRDQSLCNLSSTTLTGNTGSTGVWSQVSGPSAVITQSPAGNSNATVSGLLPNSTYKFRYTIPALFGCLSTFDEVTVNNGSFTLVPDAGTDDVYCNVQSFSLNGSQPGQGEAGSWSVLSGPSGASFSPSASHPNALLTGAVPGTYILKWTISNAICSSSDQKRIENYAIPTKANAGADQSVCFEKAILRGNTPARGIGIWSQLSGPTIAAIAAVNNPVTDVSGLNSIGVYSFVWTITNGPVCGQSTDTVRLTVSSLSPTISNAGADKIVCNVSSLQLNGNIPSSGTGTWTETGNTSTAVIVSPNSPSSTVNALNTGAHVFVWSIANSDNSCISRDTISIQNNVLPNNANAGADDTFCVFNTILLQANTAINGTSGLWTFISGPNTPRLLSPDNASCQISGVLTGTYRFRWTISSLSCPSSSDEVLITVINNADQAIAGANQTLCAQSINLYANTPTGSNKGIWSQFAGPDNAVFVSPENQNTIVNNLVPGTYSFVWKIYNERCFTTDTVIYNISQPAILNAGNDISVCNTTDSILLSAAAFSSPDNTATWSLISGGGTLTTTAPTTTPNTVIYIPEPDYTGTVVLRLSAQDQCQVVTDDKIIQLNPSSVPIAALNDTVDAEPNTVSILNVLANDIIYFGDTLNFCQQNTIVSAPLYGSVIVNNDGTITYTPQSDYTGLDSFRYQICTQQNSDSTWISNCYIEGADDAWVYITVKSGTCFIPNAFSPNGDGINDVFIIECGSEIRLSLFNSWGIELLQDEDYQNNWNGTYNGTPLPDGTYFYSVRFKSDTNEFVNKAGFICLHR